MNKATKALSLLFAIPLAAAVSFAAASTVSAVTADDLRGHTVGVTGAFNNWGKNGEPDVRLTDDDGDGVWEGTVYIDNVTKNMIEVGEYNYTYVPFRVRLDSSDEMSWGAYQRDNNGGGYTFNSPDSLLVSAEAGKPLEFKVRLCTNKLIFYYTQKTIEELGDEAYTLWPVYNEIQPISITINKSSLTLGTGEQAELVVKYNPTNTDFNVKTKWSSSAPNVASVDALGKVTAKSAGTAVITAETANGKKASCNVTVKALPTSVSLNKTSITLGKDDKTNLQVTLNPSGNAAAALKWSSSLPTVATVDASGNITAKSTGTATITVKTSNNKTASCTVTVKAYPTSVVLNKTSLSIGNGKTETLKATFRPDNNVINTLTWTSSNPNVAAVDKSGKITAKALGTTTITAETKNGKRATCKVTVKNLPTGVKLNKTSASDVV